MCLIVLLPRMAKIAERSKETVYISEFVCPVCGHEYPMLVYACYSSTHAMLSIMMNTLDLYRRESTSQQRDAWKQGG